MNNLTYFFSRLRRFVMGQADPIIDARTVQEFVAAINVKYGFELPTNLPDGSLLNEIWRIAVVVSKGKENSDIYYTAEATAPSQLMALGNIGGKVIVEVIKDEGFKIVK